MLFWKCLFKPKSLLSQELEGEECLNFYFIWIEGTLFPCLRTLLRDQIHRSSLPKNVFVFCRLILSLKMKFWRMRERKRPQRHKIVKLWGWISYFAKESQSMINFHWDLIKKIKRKCKGVLTPIFFGKGFQVMLFKFFWKIDFSKCKT